MSVVLRPTARTGSTNTDTMRGDAAHRAWCRKDEHHLSQEDRLSVVRGELLRYCELLTGSRQNAEDVAHDTLLKALSYIEGTRVHPNLSALLKRIAKNTWLDHLRKGAKCHPYGPTEIERCAESVSLGDTSFLTDAFRLLIQTLTPQQRAAVLLCDVFQFTDREAGEVLGLSCGAVKATLHRARRRLREASHRVDRDHGFDRDLDASDIRDPVQYEILEAYVSAFQAADMRALVQLCYDGTLDPVQAMRQGIQLATEQNVKSTPGESRIRDAMTHVLSEMAA